MSYHLPPPQKKTHTHTYTKIHFQTVVKFRQILGIDSGIVEREIREEKLFGISPPNTLRTSAFGNEFPEAWLLGVKPPKYFQTVVNFGQILGEKLGIGEVFYFLIYILSFLNIHFIFHFFISSDIFQYS